MIRRIWDWLMKPAPPPAPVCAHEWDVMDSKPVYRFIRNEQRIVATVFALRCKKCGDVASRRLGGG